MKPEEKNLSSFTLPRAAMFLGAKSASLSYKALTLKKKKVLYMYLCVCSQGCASAQTWGSQRLISVLSPGFLTGLRLTN